MVNKIVFDKFKDITQYPIDIYFLEAREFFQKDYPAMVSFFSGRTNMLDKSHITRLNKLTEQSMVIANLFYLKKRLMGTVDFWELLDSFEEVKTKLWTAMNISKYLRSSILANKSKAGFVFPYDLKPEQTLENISRMVLQETDFENSWTDIALENDLKEIDYDVLEGKHLNLRKRLFQADLVTSMIDNTIGERIYGKDIKRLFKFANNDLEVLGYKDTVFQTVEILSGLERGDVPEFPELGINSQFYKGVNMSQMNYPSVVREMKRNFASDNLFRDFEIKSFKLEEGDIYIEYKVNTKYDLVIIKNTTI